MSSLYDSFSKGASSALRSAAYGIGSASVQAARAAIRRAGQYVIRNQVRPYLNALRSANPRGLGSTGNELGGRLYVPAAGAVGAVARVGHRGRRATARLRSRIRGRLNRARRRARRVLRRRRAARRHKRNPYTRHRMLNKRYMRTKIVRFKRRRYSGYKIPWRRINTWFNFGRWVLFGNYLTQHNGVNMGLNQEGMTMYFNSHDDTYAGTHTMQYSLVYVPDGSPASEYYYNQLYHFNVYEGGTLGTTSYVHGYSPNYSTSVNTMPSYMAATMSRFRYSGDFSTDNTNSTAYAVMPPVPSIPVYFSGDTVNPYGQSLSSGNSFATYRMYWPCCFARVNYAIKATWPEGWNTLKGPNTSARSQVLPDNPPLYVRLIGVMHHAYTDQTYLTAGNVIQTLFPTLSPINAPLTKRGRRNLWLRHSALVFFDKVWMFNGRITPQFQAGEVLQDSEESAFVVKVPYGFSNAPNINGNVNASNATWPGAIRTKTVNWYAYAAFKCPNFRYPASVDLQPKFSSTFRFEYYCFPKMRPNFAFNPYAGMGQQAYSARMASSSSGSVGNSVEEVSLDTSPVPVSSDGSGPAESVSFTPTESNLKELSQENAIAESKSTSEVN